MRSVSSCCRLLATARICSSEDGAAGSGLGGLGGRGSLADLRRYGPAIGAAFGNGIAAHGVDVVKQLSAVNGRVVEDGAGGAQVIINGLAEMPFLRRHGERQIVVGQLFIRDEWNVDGGWIPGGFCHQTDHVVEEARGAQAAVVPGGEGSAGNGRWPRVSLLQ